jgi:hypothetical protein
MSEAKYRCPKSRADARQCLLTRDHEGTCLVAATGLPTPETIARVVARTYTDTPVPPEDAEKVAHNWDSQANRDWFYAVAAAAEQQDPEAMKEGLDTLLERQQHITLCSAFIGVAIILEQFPIAHHTSLPEAPIRRLLQHIANGLRNSVAPELAALDEGSREEVHALAAKIQGGMPR